MSWLNSKFVRTWYYRKYHIARWNLHFSEKINYLKILTHLWAHKWIKILSNSSMKSLLSNKNVWLFESFNKNFRSEIWKQGMADQKQLRIKRTFRATGNSCSYKERKNEMAKVCGTNAQWKAAKKNMLCGKPGGEDVHGWDGWTMSKRTSVGIRRWRLKAQDREE